MDDLPPDDYPPDDTPVRSKLEQTAWVLPNLNAQRFVISAVFGDHTGSTLRKCGGLSLAAFSDKLCQKMWKFALPGVNGHTPKEIAEELRVTEKDIRGLQDLDPSGRNFEASLKLIKADRRDAIVAQIAKVSSDKSLFNAGEIENLTKELRQLEASSQASLEARSPLSFQPIPAGDSSVLLGNRYLNRGDGMIIASTSGMGKSSLSLQAAATWAIGRALFGIKCNGPLRSLIFQSEDGAGDVAEVFASIFAGMKLTQAEIEIVDSRIRIVTDRVHRGDAFRAEMKAHIAAFKPDLVWINPLLAFIEGDVNEASDAGHFLREQLNSLNEPPSFAYVIIHHTVKPPKEKQDRQWNEVMYDMAGSADLINWARAIMSLRATEKEGEFNLMLAKRGRRAGVTIKTGAAGQFTEPTTVIPLKHASGRVELSTGESVPLVFWEEREADSVKELSGSPTKPKNMPKFSDFRIVFQQLCPHSGMPKGAPTLYRQSLQIRKTDEKLFGEMLAEAAHVGMLVSTSAGYHLP